jgi:tetratricopeptide (TPR) repeat protein
MNQIRQWNFLLPVLVALFAHLAACTTLQVEQEVRDGRNALVRGQLDNAVDYFSRASQLKPDYRTSYALRESVWTYLGRAYYELGKYPESRTALDKALATDNKDFMARLYQGMVITRSGERERGLAEMETALNEMHQWLDNITTDSSVGIYWDPNRQIRKTIETSLSEKPTAIEMVVMAQRIGKQLEEEIDRAERDKIRSSYDQGSKN